MKSNNKYNGSNEYQKAIDFLEKGCDCSCSSRIPKEQFAELRESFQALSKSEQDIFLMAQIKAMDGGSISTSRRLKKKTRSNRTTQSVTRLRAEMNYELVQGRFLAGLEEESNLKSVKYEAFRKL